MNAALAFFLWFTAAFLPQVSITGNVKIAGPVTINAGAASATITALCNPFSSNVGSSCMVIANAATSTGIIVGAGSESSATSCSGGFTITDSGSNSYSCDQANSPSGGTSSQLSHSSVTTGLTNGSSTISSSGAVNWSIVDMSPFAGVDTGIGSAGDITTTSASLSLGTTAHPDVCFALIGVNGTSLTITAGVGWTPIPNSTWNNSDNRFFLLEYEVVGSGIAVTATGTISTTPSAGAMTGQCYRTS